MSYDDQFETFTLLDADGDGFITADELRDAFTRLDLPLTDEEVAARVGAADLDSDERISWAEFEALCARQADEGAQPAPPGAPARRGWLGKRSAAEPPDAPRVQGADYGYRPSGYYGADVGDPSTPASGLRSAVMNFAREYEAIRRIVRYSRARDAPEAVRVVSEVVDKGLEAAQVLPPLRPDKALYPPLPALRLREKLARLELSNEAISRREEERMEAKEQLLREMGGYASALREVREATQQLTPWFVMLPYEVLCDFLDVVFDGRPIARFWFLETVARVPYFAYISMLHLFETLGWWRENQQLKQLHFAQEWNELHHLLIMEALGGDQRWVDRFLARHAAILYFWVLCTLFFISPSLSYNFSELLEAHAVDTYGEFLDANKALLRSLPAPTVAVEYYNAGRDDYLRKAMRASSRASAVARRQGTGPPFPVVTLYDTFANILADEAEHVSSMRSCQDSADDVQPGTADSESDQPEESHAYEYEDE